MPVLAKVFAMILPLIPGRRLEQVRPDLQARHAVYREPLVGLEGHDRALVEHVVRAGLPLAGQLARVTGLEAKGAGRRFISGGQLRVQAARRDR
jgi:hypothetical protein